MNITLDHFVQCSRKTSMFPVTLDQYHDQIIKIIHEWVPNDIVEKRSAEKIQEITDMAGWIIKIRDRNGEFQERDISYGCWTIWFLLFPEWALRILDQFVHGVGCWADIKHICGFLKRPNIGSRIIDVDKERIIDTLLHKLIEKPFRSIIKKKIIN